MALYDRADLLDRCRRYADRPETDLDVTVSDWYAWMTEAQSELYHEWAAMPFASVLYGPPRVLVSEDDGQTWRFPGREPGTYCFPMGRTELKAASAAANILRPGAEWAEGTDFVLEGDRVRVPLGRSFGTAPVARYIMPPAAIDAETEPSLSPPSARPLIVYRALQKWASKGGLRDPAAFELLERNAWYGKPEQGQYGILGMLQL
ncbi:MAG: hypothetical protein IT355_12035, partial [Gemmatimonadaceae bacterium]|nr:hypothetical protein [Gemmatimonadaceae bacterium]